MLHALGFPDDQIPRLLVHGWWNISGDKMSKSLGNVVDPDTLADKYGAEPLRYYLVSDMVIGQDADFSEERLITRYNTDLANNLGNLLNRTLSMAQRYREGRLGAAGTGSPLPAEAEKLATGYATAMEAWETHRAAELLGNFVTACNGYIETSAPWKMAKDPAQAGALDEVLAALAEGLRLICNLLFAFCATGGAGNFPAIELGRGAEPGRSRLGRSSSGTHSRKAVAAVSPL